MLRTVTSIRRILNKQSFQQIPVPSTRQILTVLEEKTVNKTKFLVSENLPGKIGSKCMSGADQNCNEAGVGVGQLKLYACNITVLFLS